MAGGNRTHDHLEFDHSASRKEQLRRSNVIMQYPPRKEKGIPEPSYLLPLDLPPPEPLEPFGSLNFGALGSLNFGSLNFGLLILDSLKPGSLKLDSLEPKLGSLEPPPPKKCDPPPLDSANDSVGCR